MIKATRGRHEISDVELEERCRPHAWERSLRTLEIIATLLGGSLTAGVVSVYLMQVDFCIAGFLAVVVALGIWITLSFVNGRLPIAADREELAFRHWRAGRLPFCPPEKLAIWCRRMAAQEPEPDWLVVLQGAALPHGGTVWVMASIMLDQSNPSRLMARQFKGFGISGPQPSTEENPLIRRSLSKQEWEELTGLLAKSFPEDFKSFPRWEVIDGFPCDLLILCKNPRADSQVSLNLAARAANVHEPSVALMSRLLLMGRDGQGGLLFGSTDPHGGDGGAGMTVGEM